MKLLCDHLSLKGKKETISVSEFRTRPGEVLAQVILGKEYALTKNGKVVATITGPKTNDTNIHEPKPINHSGK
jgi:antitoxin (DNA-binding transcriptional repressor) of toxin-antitoxin stability system